MTTKINNPEIHYFIIIIIMIIIIIIIKIIIVIKIITANYKNLVIDYVRNSHAVLRESARLRFIEIYGSA